MADMSSTTIGDALHVAKAPAGVSSSANHQIQWRRIASAMLAQMTRKLELSVVAEAADVIAINCQLEDGEGTTKTGVVQFLVELLDANALRELLTAFTIAETGAGAEVSATAKAALMFTTDAAGVAQLSITDAAGASGKTTTVVITPMLNGAFIGLPTFVNITFD